MISYMILFFDDKSSNSVSLKNNFMNLHKCKNFCI